MKIYDLLQETYFSLTVNKMRSSLTILGIVIGIGSVIAMISIGQGASGSIQSSIQSIGSNLVLVMPGAQRGPGVQVSAGRGSAQTLTQEDANAIIKEVTLAKAVAPEISKRYQVTAAQRFLAGDTYVTTISVEAQDQNSMADIQQQITDLLLERHHIADSQLADFNVLNQADIAATASSVTNTLTILLGAIAGISLIVGGIGIMNMMLTTVTERTREIGLRKAIGAKKKDISAQFLTESVMLTFLGGIIGIIFGWLAAWAVTQFAGITTQISLLSITLAVGVSATIGIVFGYYPARRAANLNPIEALRYE